jgi:hypothetical protein
MNNLGTITARVAGILLLGLDRVPELPWCGPLAACGWGRRLYRFRKFE